MLVEYPDMWVARGVHLKPLLRGIRWPPSLCGPLVAARTPPLLPAIPVSPALP